MPSQLEGCFEFSFTEAPEAKDFLPVRALVRIMLRGGMFEYFLSWWRLYPYFWLLIMSLIVLLFLLKLLPRSVRQMPLYGGLVFIAVLPTFLLFEGNYWTPTRLSGWVISLEDVLCLFVLGSISTAVALIPYRKVITCKSQSLRLQLASSARLLLLGLGVFFLLFCVGLSPHSSCLAGFAAMGITILVIKRHLWPLAVSGALLYTPYYCFMLWFAFLLWPDFSAQWSYGDWFGVRVLGFPLGELVWAPCFGAAYPVAVAFCFDAHLTKGAGPEAK